MEDRRFERVFDKCGVPDNLRNLMSGVEISAIRFDKKARQLLVELSVGADKADSLTEDALNRFRECMMKQFAIEQIFLDVKNIALMDKKIPAEQKLPAIREGYMTRCKSPMANAALRDSEWRMKNGVCHIALKNNTAQMLRFRNIDLEIERYIQKKLGISIAVELISHATTSTEKTADSGANVHAPPRETAKAHENITPLSIIPSGITPLGAAPNGDVPIKYASDSTKQARAPHGFKPKDERSPNRPPINGKSKTKVVETIKGDPLPLSNNFAEGQPVVVTGRVINSNIRPLKSGSSIITFDITDGSNSLTVKFFADRSELNTYKQLLVVKQYIVVKGNAQFDTYAKEINIMAKELCKGQDLSIKRMDNAPVKRVELHMHTQMSSMDAINSATDLINRASAWGHDAIAITDHGVVQAFPEAMNAAKKTGIKVIYGVEAYLVDDLDKPAGVVDPLKSKYYHAIILVKNKVGLKNLYELISISHLQYFYKRPRILKSCLANLREGLIIGTACEAGEFFKAVLRNEPEKRIDDLARFYDYFEIQPVDNNMYLLREGKVASVQRLFDINKKIAELARQYNKPVVATCDVHFMDPDDEVYRRIIMAGDGYKDAERQPPLYLRTTEEMLTEFSYLGAELAYEAVVTNPRAIADNIERIKPIPDETFPPKIDGAEDTLKEIVWSRARNIYGDPLPEAVRNRLTRELESIIKNGFSVMYMIAQKLVQKSNDDGYSVGSRGSVGSSLVATMAGITEVNPLPPHYLCPHCQYSEFDTPAVLAYAGGSGCDMPGKLCPHCGAQLKGEGHDIPFETFLGFDGDKEPDIDLNFSGKYQLKAHAYCEELFGAGNVFKAGTIATLADKTAYGYVIKYFEGKANQSEEPAPMPRQAEINRLKMGLTGIKRTTGQHPGGIMVLPRGHSIYEFCPVQRPANDSSSDVVTTHFDYHSISGRLLKLDLLGHDVPTIVRMLHDITGVNPLDVPLNDPKALSLFTSPDALGVTARDIACQTGSLGLPEFGTQFVRQMLLDTMPASFAELVRISGLSHGTDVWINNAADLIRDGLATLKEIIPSRDDIMLFLIRQGVEKKAAFKIMENVRKGKGLTNDEVEKMLDAGVPEWYIDSCNKIKYLFPKGHAVAYVMMTVRIGYYKVYYPYSFYAASFSVKATDFDIEMCKGRESLLSSMRELSEQKDLSAKDKNKISIMELVNEMYARGLKFCPLDIYKASVDEFLVTQQGLMPPLCAIQGLGLSAAQSIVDARNDREFFTVDDFRERTKTNKTVLELLRKNGVLKGIPETNQLTLEW